MDEAERRAMESELLFYITAALVTFLAALVSFKWVYRKTVKTPTMTSTTSTTTLDQGNMITSSTETEDDLVEEEEMENSCPVHSRHREAHAQSHTNDKSQQMSSGDGCPIFGDMDLADIQDVLINHEDIMPLGASARQDAMTGTTTTADEGPGEEEVVLGEDGKPLAGPQKTKKLVEEVSKMMSDEQKAEERKIQSEQLQAIFSLVQDQEGRFGIDSFQDIQDQFKLYA